ncbi:MAG: succinate dehydrogenase assembly factor 2 [Gammaproteobacteria bacterium]|nr:succinate dehydrogenase assembly factor 2 [Gammaproteobacteria bacterium]MDH5652596.1 succinate dehydrogenase assembly factor 2 [Gammaproteobacteria bacterium]
METLSAQQNLSRLRWQCRRGMLELDLFLSGFLNNTYSQLDHRQQQIFEDILGLPDQTLLEYLLGQNQPDDKDIAHVIQQIRNSAGPHA